MSEKNTGYKVGHWIAKHPKQSIFVALAALIFWGVGKYDSYRIKANAKAAQEQKVAEATAEKNRALEVTQHADWVKIYTLQTLNESKGGVFLEKHSFGDDRIAVRQSSISSNETNYYIDKNSIIDTADDLKQANFRTDYSKDGNHFQVITYQINCKSNTAKEAGSFWVLIQAATTKTEIEQSTGKTSVVELPQKITIDHIDNASKAWRTIDSSNEKKYADALCNQNFSTKIDTKVYSN